MIYKFKKWVILPAYAEVVIKADTDEEALKIINNLDSNSLTWQEAETVEQRTTYEVIDERSSD
tara:strand:- start:190 stop:378 length:189 start_codon:yes stop_codon:yes gene_type:complete